MAISFEQKKALVAEVSEVAKTALSAVVAEYHGLTAGELDELRASARESGAYLRVVKNRLAKRAIEGTEYECLNDELVGPLILGFSLEDPGAAPRILHGFAKDHDKLVIKAAAISGQLVPGSDIERLAKLPTRDQALAMLAGVLQAPVSKFVRTVNEPVAQLARTFGAVRDQKQAA